MTRSIAAFLLAFATGAGTTLLGCAGPRPFVRAGNADTVEVVFGGDVANALPSARRHCAQFERVPRLVNAGEDMALFDCVPR
jgi:hypothetical protein